ncbi:MAG TPA: restriction endonuclease subunit S [Spirochaetota bacterium]|nr:restriction endonuclease subunit S [Spirochaetota bacterium]
MNNWQQQKLGNVADVILSNVDKKTDENERTIRLCNYTDVYKNSFINIKKSKNFMIASCNENEYDKFLLRKGQVAITKDSETPDDIGVSTYITDDFEDVVLGYHLSLITPYMDKLNGRFLYYWLNTRQSKRYFENNAGGSGQRCTLTLDCIKSIPLHLPNPQTQQRIAAVLSSLDAKIELNNHINAELEAMAKTLYDYWFVQFDFPDKNGKPYKSSGGKLVWNNELKREIPEGWEVESIEQCCDIIDCLHSKKPDYNFENDYSYLLQLENLLNNGLIDISYKYYVSYDDYKKWTSKIEVRENDILITNAGRVAATVQVPKEIITGIGRNITAIRPTKIKPTYLFLSFRGIDMLRQIKWNTDSGAFFSSFNVKGIKNLFVLKPQVNIEDNFELLVYSLRRKRELLQNENQVLAQIRDWLLPMLMNGQVKVM